MEDAKPQEQLTISRFATFNTDPRRSSCGSLDLPEIYADHALAKSKLPRPLSERRHISRPSSEKKQIFRPLSERKPQKRYGFSRANARKHRSLSLSPKRPKTDACGKRHSSKEKVEAEDNSTTDNPNTEEKSARKWYGRPETGEKKGMNSSGNRSESDNQIVTKSSPEHHQSSGKKVRKYPAEQWKADEKCTRKTAPERPKTEEKRLRKSLPERPKTDDSYLRRKSSEQPKTIITMTKQSTDNNNENCIPSGSLNLLKSKLDLEHKSASVNLESTGKEKPGSLKADSLRLLKAKRLNKANELAIVKTEEVLIHSDNIEKDKQITPEAEKENNTKGIKNQMTAPVKVRISDNQTHHSSMLNVWKPKFSYTGNTESKREQKYHSGCDQGSPMRTEHSTNKTNIEVHIPTGTVLEIEDKRPKNIPRFMPRKPILHIAGSRREANAPMPTKTVKASESLHTTSVQQKQLPSTTQRYFDTEKHIKQNQSVSSSKLTAECDKRSSSKTNAISKPISSASEGKQKADEQSCSKPQINLNNVANHSSESDLPPNPTSSGTENKQNAEERQPIQKGQANQVQKKEFKSKRHITTAVSPIKVEKPKPKPVTTQDNRMPTDSVTKGSKELENTAIQMTPSEEARKNLIKPSELSVKTTSLDTKDSMQTTIKESRTKPASTSTLQDDQELSPPSLPRLTADSKQTFESRLNQDLMSLTKTAEVQKRITDAPTDLLPSQHSSKIPKNENKFNRLPLSQPTLTIQKETQVSSSAGLSCTEAKKTIQDSKGLHKISSSTSKSQEQKKPDQPSTKEDLLSVRNPSSNQGDQSKLTKATYTAVDRRQNYSLPSPSQSAPGDEKGRRIKQISSRPPRVSTKMKPNGILVREVQLNERQNEQTNMTSPSVKPLFTSTDTKTKDRPIERPATHSTLNTKTKCEDVEKTYKIVTIHSKHTDYTKRSIEPEEQVTHTPESKPTLTTSTATSPDVKTEKKDGDSSSPANISKDKDILVFTGPTSKPPDGYHVKEEKIYLLKNVRTCDMNTPTRGETTAEKDPDDALDGKVLDDLSLITNGKLKATGFKTGSIVQKGTKPTAFATFKSKNARDITRTPPSDEERSVQIPRKDSYELIYAERQSLLKAEFRYRKRIKELEDETSEVLKSIENLKSENKLLQSKIDDFEREKAMTLKERQKITQLENENNDLQNTLKSLLEEQKSKARGDSLSKLMDNNEVEEMRKRLDQLERDANAVNEENVRLKDENVQMMNQLQVLEVEKSHLESSVTAVESEKLTQLQNVENMQAKMVIEIKELKESKERMMRKAKSLEYENRTLSENLAQKKGEVEELLNAMMEESKLDSTAKQLKNRIITLTQEKQAIETEFEEEKERLLDKLDEIKHSIAAKRQNFDDIKITNLKLETENEKLANEKEFLKKQNAMQKKDIQDLQYEVERLKNELKGGKEKYDEVKNEASRIRKDLDTTRKKLEESQKDVYKVRNEKEQRIQVLVSDLEFFRNENEMEVSTLKEEVENVKTENARLRVMESKALAMEIEMKKLSETLEKVEKEKEELTVEVANKVEGLDIFDKQRRILKVKKDKYIEIEAYNRRLIEENKKLRSEVRNKEVSVATRHDRITRIDSKDDYRKDAFPRENIFGSKNEKGAFSWVGSMVPQSVISTTAVYVKSEDDDRTKGYINLRRQVVFAKAKAPDATHAPSPSRMKEHSQSRNIRSVQSLTRDKMVSSLGSSSGLPYIDHEPRLTFGLGYSDIHKNKIMAARSKKVQ